MATSNLDYIFSIMNLKRYLEGLLTWTQRYIRGLISVWKAATICLLSVAGSGLILYRCSESLFQLEARVILSSHQLEWHNSGYCKCVHSQPSGKLQILSWTSHHSPVGLFPVEATALSHNNPGLWASAVRGSFPPPRPGLWVRQFLLEWMQAKRSLK